MATYDDLVVSMETALQRFGGDGHARLAEFVPANYGASSDLAHLMFGLVSGRKPTVVLELGVAHGVSTTAILKALDSTGSGHLWSLDLPPLTLSTKEVGDQVPASLRGRWTLQLGPSALRLPGIAAEIGPVDLFLHDGDHTYDHQLADLRAVWPHMRQSGGLVVVDNVWNVAFLDFCKEVGRDPVLLRGSSETDAIGIVAT